MVLAEVAAALPARAHYQTFRLVTDPFLHGQIVLVSPPFSIQNKNHMHGMQTRPSRDEPKTASSPPGIRFQPSVEA